MRQTNNKKSKELFMLRSITAVLACSLALSGCIVPKTYVDPNYVKVTAADIKPVAMKYKSSVTVEFRQNGELKSSVHNMLQAKVDTVLRNTNVFDSNAATTPFQLTVVVNNVADTSAAIGKGFLTGLTFGASGSLVTDYYEISISYTDSSGAKKQKDYKHALHTTIGNKESPFPQVPATSVDAGFEQLLSQVIVNFITDLQQEGLLTKHLLLQRTPQSTAVAP